MVCHQTGPFWGKKHLGSPLALTQTPGCFLLGLYKDYDLKDHPQQQDWSQDPFSQGQGALNWGPESGSAGPFWGPPGTGW